MSQPIEVLHEEPALKPIAQAPDLQFQPDSEKYNSQQNQDLEPVSYVEVDTQLHLQ